MDEATLYGITKNECLTLLNSFDNDLGKLAFVLWNRGRAKSIESGLKKAKRIKNFAKN